MRQDKDTYHAQSDNQQERPEDREDLREDREERPEDREDLREDRKERPEGRKGFWESHEMLKVLITAVTSTVGILGVVLTVTLAVVNSRLDSMEARQVQIFADFKADLKDGLKEVKDDLKETKTELTAKIGGVSGQVAENTETLEDISEQVVDNTETLEDISEQVVDNTETLEDISEQVVDNSKKLEELQGADPESSPVPTSAGIGGHVDADSL